MPILKSAISLSFSFCLAIVVGKNQCPIYWQWLDLNWSPLPTKTLPFTGISRRTQVSLKFMLTKLRSWDIRRIKIRPMSANRVDQTLFWPKNTSIVCSYLVKPRLSPWMKPRIRPSHIWSIDCIAQKSRCFWLTSTWILPEQVCTLEVKYARLFVFNFYRRKTRSFARVGWLHFLTPRRQTI